MPCERCVNRREFLARAAEAAGVTTLATIVACGDGQLNGPANTVVIPPGTTPPRAMIKIGDFPDLAFTGRLVKVPSFYAVKRIGADTFDAFSMACTHIGCLTDIVDGQTFHCPCHNSRFANDGSVINGPDTGESIRPLQKLATSYDPATDLLTIG
jgi:cytochrome b6-f complex iron-sulfur subunit